MVSKLWQPGVDSRTAKGRTSRGAILLEFFPETARARISDQSVPRMQQQHGWRVEPGKKVGSNTFCRARQQLMKGKKPKKGGKEFSRVGRGSDKSLLRIPSTDASKLEPSERVEALLEIFERELSKRSQNTDQWAVVKLLKQMYPHYLTPVFSGSRIGSIPGIERGQTFRSRAAMSLVGLHCQSQAGIDTAKYFNPKDGISTRVAVSLVFSGMYEDDRDDGDLLTYTGHGGNDLKGSRKQYKNQVLEGGNLALYHTYQYKLFVRVIRRFELGVMNPLSSPRRYLYDGLYKVVSYERKLGLSNFIICEYKLQRVLESAVT